MSWLNDWKAISAYVQGVIEASRFYIDSLRTSETDSRGVGSKRLIPQIKNVLEAIERFQQFHGTSIPENAALSLKTHLEGFAVQFPNINKSDAYSYIHLTVTLLASFRSEFEYHLADSSAVAKRLSERAFLHLQRTIVVDREARNKWMRAYKSGEVACEALGGVHLLSHGIWAFKVNAAGERTDIIFNDPLPSDSSIERSAESLVLTEWKLVNSPKDTDRIAKAARRQAARYASGSLGGLVLTGYRFIVLVSQKTLTLPMDEVEDNMTYRHVNIVVDPDSPSKIQTSHANSHPRA